MAYQLIIYLAECKGGYMGYFLDYNAEDEEFEEPYTYDDYLEDRADEEYHRMKDEGEI